MNNSGNYDRLFTWMKRTVSQDSTTGQMVETFTSNGNLWGSCKEVSASKKLAYGIMNSVIDYEIHLRQYPAVDPKDRLMDTWTGLTVVIKGLTQLREDNETLIYAEYIPTVANS